MEVRLSPLPAQYEAAHYRTAPIGQPVPIADNITHTRRFAYRRSASFANPFVGEDYINTEARRMFMEWQNSQPELLDGIVDVRRHWILGSIGMLINPADMSAPCGWPLHIEPQFAAAGFRTFPEEIGRFSEHDAFEKDYVLPDRDRVALPPGLLLAQPALWVYGHWLLDMLPRLYTARAVLAGTNLPVYHYNIPDYAAPFLEWAGIPAERLIRLDPTIVYESEQLLVPAPVRRGYAVNMERLGEALHSFRVACLSQPLADDAGAPDLIYLSRAEWLHPLADRTRYYANLPHAEQVLDSLGFVTVCPEQHSPAALQHMLRRARIVVGVDGSGLHNSFLAASSCRVVVICRTMRQNFWHGAFAACMGQQLTFVQTSPSEDGDVIPLGQLHAACG